MYPGEFEVLFRKIADLYTLEMSAKKRTVEGSFPQRNPHTPVWDTVDVFSDHEYIDVGDGRYVSSRILSKVRVPFFVLLAEFESRLYRIHEWNGKELEYLNETHLNDLIKELANSDLITLQKEYSKRSDFMNDMKALSSFRNVIMHINKKLEKTIDVDVFIKRKQQIVKLLLALQQILDNMQRIDNKIAGLLE